MKGLPLIARFVIFATHSVFVLACYGLHKDIPQILSGVDQIFFPFVLRVTKWFSTLSVSIYLATAALALFRWRAWVSHLVWICLSIAVINASIAFAMFFIDTFDMYPHFEEERLTVDVLITLLLAHAVMRLRKAES